MGVLFSFCPSGRHKYGRSKNNASIFYGQYPPERTGAHDDDPAQLHTQGTRHTPFQLPVQAQGCRLPVLYQLCQEEPLPLDQCVCLEERIEAGVLDLFEFVRDRFGAAWAAQLQKRLEKYLSRKDAGFFLHDAHRERWKLCLDRRYQMNKAALFLLTAYEDIWSRMVWAANTKGPRLLSVRLSGIRPELYCVYQAARAIYSGTRGITAADLADPELVSDEAFQLIITALLLDKYGNAILKFDEKRGDTI